MKIPAGKFVLIILITLTSSNLFAQVGIGTTTPDSKALLEVNGTTKGVLFPKLTPAQRTILGASLTAAQKGLLLCDSASGREMYWNGTAFALVGPQAKLPLQIVGDSSLRIAPGGAFGHLLSWDGNNWISAARPSYPNMPPFLVLNYCISLYGTYPSPNSTTPFVGEIALYAFNHAPNGWAPCNGQLLSIASNTTLFQLIGTYYGGDGVTTFALPDLRGRMPIHYGQGPGLTNYYFAETGGSETSQ